jgi:hypothetical protein
MRSSVELASADPAGCDKRPPISDGAQAAAQWPRRRSSDGSFASIFATRAHPTDCQPRLPAEKPNRSIRHAPREFGADSGRQLVSHVVCARPTRIAGGRGRRSGRARSVDRVGPSVKAAGEAADVAMSGAARRIDGEIAGAAVGAAIGSAGRGRAAPQTAVRHASARDRHGRGTRIQCPVPYWSRVSRTHIALNAAARPWFAR